MILPQMQLTEINGGELEILDTGSGEPVMFVHGGMGDECFAVLAEPALTNRYRLIHYHRRGWGNSERPEAPRQYFTTGDRLQRSLATSGR